MLSPMRPLEVALARVEQAGRDGVRRRVDERHRLPRQLERTRDVAAEVRVVERPPPEGGSLDRVVHPRLALEVDRAFEVPVRVRVGVDGLRGPGGIDRAPVGLLREARLREVVGELGGRADRARVGQLGPGLEPAGEPLVEPAAGARQELVLDGLAHQLVPEPVPRAGRLELQDAALDRRGQPGLGVVLGDVEHLGEEALVDRAAGDRDGVDDAPCRRPERGDAGEHDLDQRQGPLDGVAARGDELLDEQRVALRPPPQAVGEARGLRATRDHPQLAVDRRAVQPAELDDDRLGGAGRPPRATRGSGGRAGGRARDTSGRP